jgi:hypothetical protein
MQRGLNKGAENRIARVWGRPFMVSARPWLLLGASLVGSPIVRAQETNPQPSVVEPAADAASVAAEGSPSVEQGSAPAEPAAPSVSPPPQETTAEPPFFSLVGDRVGRGIGVETSLMWPLFPGSLFQLRTAIPVAFDGRAQLVVGAQGHIPHDRPAEGRFMSLAGQVGLRGYLWKGLHLDALSTVGVGRLEGSVVDGQTYNSLDVELMALVGWRFEAGPVYALLQPVGISSVVYRSNPWEIVGQGRRTSEPPIYIANVILGAQF